jgi:hypothetical protein
MADPVRPRFDPYEALKALDRAGVAYILVGAFARVIQGTEEITRGLDVVPSTKPDNLRRLHEALAELHAEREDGRELRAEAGAFERVMSLRTDAGEMKVVVEPEGTQGFDDLRRAANREPLGQGVRPLVASIGDLARMLGARGRDIDRENLRMLRRLVALERSHSRSWER